MSTSYVAIVHPRTGARNCPKKPEWIITVSRLGYRFEGYYSIRSKLKLEVLSHNRLTAGAFRPTQVRRKRRRC